MDKLLRAELLRLYKAYAVKAMPKVIDVGRVAWSMLWNEAQDNQADATIVTFGSKMRLFGVEVHADGDMHPAEIRFGESVGYAKPTPVEIAEGMTDVPSVLWRLVAMGEEYDPRDDSFPDRWWFGLFAGDLNRGRLLVVDNWAPRSPVPGWRVGQADSVALINTSDQISTMRRALREVK